MVCGADKPLYREGRWPYLQGRHRTVRCQVQVLSQVEVISKHGEMSCQKVVVLDSLQIKAEKKYRILYRWEEKEGFYFSQKALLIRKRYQSAHSVV